MELIDLERNSHKIGEAKVNEEGCLTREVNGVEIIQIEEKTTEDVKKNMAINLWRMR